MKKLFFENNDFFFLFQFGVYWSFCFAVCLRQCRQCCQHRHLFRSQSLSKMSGFGSQNARWILQSYDLRSLWRWILLVVYERNLRFALLKPIRYNNNKSFQHVLSTYLLMQNPSKIPIFREITWHFYLISGCTFWGKKPWSRKKKLLWQLGTLVGAPVGIAFLACISVPAMLIGIPSWVGRKMYEHYKTKNKHKRRIG